MARYICHHVCDCWRTPLQVHLLHQAAEALRQCEALEARLIRDAAPERRTARHARPPPPVILNRSSTSVSVTPSAMQLRTTATVAFFAVYCKPFGAGVELAMNPTATQYAGTGTLTPIGQRATVTNLQPNNTYVFAVAVYDENRNLIGSLGAHLLPFRVCYQQSLSGQYRPLSRAGAMSALYLEDA